MLILESIGILCLVLIPGTIPLYCLGTFMWGFLDSVMGEINEETAINKRYQVYSLYRFGVKLHRWMTERVK